MRGRTHLAAGFACGIILASQAELPLAEAAAAIGAAAVGSLLPDVDICTSRLGRTITPVSAAVQVIAGHRTIFHGLLLYLICFGISWLVWPDYRLCYIAAGLGVLSHLLIDTLNPSGVPLFWPLKPRLRIASFRTGGFADWTLGVGLTIATLIYAAQHFHII